MGAESLIVNTHGCFFLGARAYADSVISVDDIFFIPCLLRGVYPGVSFHRFILYQSDFIAER
jgi:hypothetical protein